MSKTDLALQAWSKGPLHPWVIARDEMYNAAGGTWRKTWSALHPNHLLEQGPFDSYDACEQWVRARLAPAEFEIDEAPAATLRASDVAFEQRLAADRADGFKGLAHDELLAKHGVAWARFWMIGRWEKDGQDTPDQWREFTKYLRKHAPDALEEHKRAAVKRWHRHAMSSPKDRTALVLIAIDFRGQ